RQIGTFIDADHAHIWGQGATAKTRDAARPVINGQTDEAVRLLKAFGAENNRGAPRDGTDNNNNKNNNNNNTDADGGFVWDEWYGTGFDVLHMGTPKRFLPSASPTAAVVVVGNTAVALALAELGVGCAKGSVEGGDLRFEDNDPARTV